MGSKLDRKIIFNQDANPAKNKGINPHSRHYFYPALTPLAKAATTPGNVTALDYRTAKYSDARFMFNLQL